MYKSFFLLIFLLNIFSINHSEASNPKNIDASVDYIESNYYQYIALADLAYLQNDYQKAYHYYRKAEKKTPLLNRFGYLETEKYINLLLQKNKTKKAEYYLLELLKKGYPLEYFKQKNFGCFIVQCKNIDNYLKNIEVNQKNDSIYMRAIAKLNLLHSSFRDINECDTIKNKFKLLDSLSDKMEFYFLRMIDQFGFPTLSRVGWENKDFIDDLSFLMAHIARPHLLYYRMIKAVRDGSCDPYVLAVLVDSYCLARSSDNMFLEKFIYGIYQNIEDMDLYDLRNIDERRREIGLCPISIQREINNILCK